MARSYERTTSGVHRAVDHELPEMTLGFSPQKLSALKRAKTPSNLSDAVETSRHLLQIDDNEGRLEGIDVLASIAPRLEPQQVITPLCELCDTLDQKNWKYHKQALTGFKKIVDSTGIGLGDANGRLLWGRLHQKLYGGNPEVLDALKILSIGRPEIPATVLSTSTIDPDFKVNRKLLNQAIRMGVVEQTEGGFHKIPIKDPRAPWLLEASRRTTKTYTDPSFVFKGAGCHLGEKTSFGYRGKSILGAPIIIGGEMKPYIQGGYENANDLVRIYHKNENSDPALELAKEYGVTDDLFIKPIAVFKPIWIPQRREGKKADGIKMVRKANGMSLSRVPKTKAEELRVYMYAVPSDERLCLQKLNMQPNFSEGGQFWDRMKELADDLKGSKVEGLETRRKIAYRAAAGFAAFQHIVHHHMGGACSGISGGVFQGTFHNVNPFTCFDYDTILNAEEYAAMKGGDGERFKYQNTDQRGAKHILQMICYMLELPSEEIDKTHKIFDEIYGLGRKTKK